MASELRLPTGIFYAQGVKAKVVFFDHKPARPEPWTDRLWVYDMRTNKEFTLKTRPLKPADMDEFVEVYHAENRHERTETWNADANPGGRGRSYTYAELIARDKAGLDIFWLRDDRLEDSADLPDPDILAAEILEDLQDALDQFARVQGARADEVAA